MTQQKRLKRQNFLAKDKLRAVSIPILFLAVVFKLAFLGKTGTESGVVYYVVPFLFVFFLMMIFALTIRDVVKKAVSFRVVRNQYKNAVRMIKTGALSGLLLGALLFLFLTLAAGKLTDSVFLLQAYGNFPMILTAVSIPFLLLCAALVGGLDGFGFTAPDSTSRIVFAVSDLLFGVLLIFLAGRMGGKHSLLLHDDRVTDAFAASGAGAAFAAAAVFSAIWLLALTGAFRRRIRKQLAEDTRRSLESFSEQLIGLFLAFGQPFLRFFCLYGSVILDQLLYFRLTKASEGVDSGIWAPGTVYTDSYATAFLWLLIPFGFSLMLNDACRDELNKIMKKDAYHGGMRILITVKQYLCTVLPMLAVFAVCLLPLNQSAFSLSADPSSSLAFFAVPAVLCFGMLESEMLRGVGREWSGIFCSLAALALQTAAAVLIFPRNHDGTMLLVCHLIYALVYAIGCAAVLIRYCVYRKHLTLNLILPLASAFAAGIAAILCMFLKSAIGVLPAAIIALLVSAAVHTLALVASGCVREGEAHEFPQQSALVALGRLLGMY